MAKDVVPIGTRVVKADAGRVTRDTKISSRGCERCRWHFDNVCYTPSLVNDKAIGYAGGAERWCPNARMRNGKCGIDGRYFEEHVSSVEAARLAEATSAVAVAATRASFRQDIDNAVDDALQAEREERDGEVTAALQMLDAEHIKKLREAREHSWSRGCMFGGILAIVVFVAIIALAYVTGQIEAGPYT